MQTTINRKFKDRLFRLAFQEKQDLLDLYNAVSGRQYTNPEELAIMTLEDAIYLGMKNDVSFLVSDVLNLYEHQSSFNPNMPIRGLNYFADTYRYFIDEHRLDVYGETLVRLPLPQYIVFYNGTREEPDRLELKLSDAFICQNPEEKGSLECRAIMLNINYGHNRELMERCKRLRDYAVFVDRIRENCKRGMILGEAVKLAVDSCIKEGILADILKKNRAEVYDLILYEYDEQKQLELAREGAMQAGRKAGFEAGLEDGRAAGLKDGRAVGLKEGRAAGLEEGRAAGREEGKIAIIRKKMERHHDLSTISDMLEMDEAYVEKVMNLIMEGKTDFEIASIICNPN